MTRSITLPGDLVGYYESTLFSKVTGYLKRIDVDKGDRVKAGQALAVIEVPELAQQLQKANANLDIQRVSYERLQNVWKSDPRLVARQDVDVAFSKFLEARAQVDELRAIESYTRIVAPFDGVVTGRFVDPGALIKAGGNAGATAREGSVHSAGASTPVVSEAMIDVLRVYTYVPQDAVPLIRTGTPAAIAIANLPKHSFHGHVTRFANSLDLNTRTMLTEVDLANPRHELYPGTYANVTLQLEYHPKALKLPESSIGDSKGGGNQVMLVHNARLIKRGITVGIRTGHYAEITGGLNENDEVLAVFDPSLSPGERVNAQLQKPRPPAGALVSSKQ
jgi:multidrug efflux pump subunit AcrA (membrane-fusion protein)